MGDGMWRAGARGRGPRFPLGARRIGILAAFLASAPPASAQTVGIGPHVSTLGIGADIGVASGNRIAFRASGNFFPFDLDFSASEVDFTVDLPSPQFTALVDLFLVGGFRLSGGLRFANDDVRLAGNVTGSVQLGGTTYTASDVGDLTGAIVTNDVAPYAGLGFGRLVRRGVGFLLDLGVAFQGDPAVALAADGPLSAEPLFQQDLEAERQQIENDLDLFRYYPVVSVGLAIGIR